jgi:hypothetical protein
LSPSGQLGIIPSRLGVAAVGSVELGQHVRSAIFRNLGIHEGDELFIILIVQLAGQFETDCVGGRPVSISIMAKSAQ